jgi:PAS domain S-box-containing protein
MLKNDYYHAIIRTAMDGFWLLDVQGRFVDVNDAYCELIGYSREELLQMNIADVEVNETPSETAAHLAALKMLGAERFDTRHRTRSGRCVDLEISANYQPEQGRIFVFLRDITHRRHADHALHLREMSLNSLLDLSQSAFTMQEREIIQLALEEVERLTESQIGYLHFINPDQKIKTGFWGRVPCPAQISQ